MTLVVLFALFVAFFGGAGAGALALSIAYVWWFRDPVHACDFVRGLFEYPNPNIDKVDWLPPWVWQEIASRRGVLASEVPECTREPPHQCRVNGPCNGYPREPPGTPAEQLAALEAGRAEFDRWERELRSRVEDASHTAPPQVETRK
jgi:hypothetical protein